MSLDKHTIKICGDITLGYYGGNIENGANRNEDGTLILCSKSSDWKSALLLDGHATSCYWSTKTFMNTAPCAVPVLKIVQSMQYQ